MEEKDVIKLDKKKEESKLKRWNAISESAAKQSKRTIIPEVKTVMTFGEALQYAQAQYDKKVIPYEHAEGMDSTRTISSAQENDTWPGLRIFSTDPFASSKPMIRIRAATARPDKYSKRA